MFLIIDYVDYYLNILNIALKTFITLFFRFIKKFKKITKLKIVNTKKIVSTNLFKFLIIKFVVFYKHKVKFIVNRILKSYEYHYNEIYEKYLINNSSKLSSNIINKITKKEICIFENEKYKDNSIKILAILNEPLLNTKIDNIIKKNIHIEILNYKDLCSFLFLNAKYETYEKIIGLWSNERTSYNYEEIYKDVRILGDSWFAAIGHIAGIDFYLKNEILKNNNLSDLKIYYDFPNSMKINKYFFSLFDKYFKKEKLEIFNKKLIKDEFWNVRTFSNTTSTYFKATGIVLNEWNRRNYQPIISFPEKDKKIARQLLNTIGLNEGGWFVSLHVRESGFHSEWHKKHPGTRNANIDTYLKAINKIISLGGQVIRLGDNSMKKLPKIDGLIDYAHSPVKSEMLDIYLCCECKFLIGTNSGISLIPAIFNKKSLLTNWSPIGILNGYNEDLFIPKKIINKKNNKYLTIREIYENKIDQIQFDNQYKDLNCEYEDNTDKEIYEAVLDMFNYLNIGYPNDNKLIEINHYLTTKNNYCGSKIAKSALNYINY